ncbi:hypothetical protein ABPG72_000922 [Tetrahymena utriculariae]
MQALPQVYPQTPLLSPQLQTLQWLSQLNPYQQALLLPLLSQNTPLQSPLFISAKEDEVFPQINKESLFSLNHLQQSPLSYYLNDNQMTESTQENSPKLAYYNLGLGMNDCFSLQDKPIYASANALANNLSNIQLIAPIQKKIKKQKSNNSAKKAECDNVLTNIRKESCESVIQSSGFKSPTLSSNKSNASNSLNLNDDKNIIHINFTKNLLKSFRRYCEYYHKNNQQLLQQIKTDFETNHMNNQLLVHFMTSAVTQEYFQMFVDGPAQKWVKEQSRLKKQDQQLELIEICRQRLFDKIKVKKYCDTVSNPIQIEDNLSCQSPAMSPAAIPTAQPLKKSSSLTARPIFSQIGNISQPAVVKSALSSSSSDSSESSYEDEIIDQKNNQSSNNRREECDLEEEESDNSQSRQINNENIQSMNKENNVLQESFEVKNEEIENSIKIEDGF